MKTKKIRKINVMVLALVFMASQAFAMGERGWGPGEGEGPGGPEGNGKFEEKMQKKMDKMLSDLGLSEEQLKQIKEQHGVQKDAQKKIFSQLREKREALKQAIDAPETDRARIDTLVGEMSTLMTEKMKTRVEAELSLKKILTPEQYTRLRAKKEEMFKEVKGRGKHGRRHPGPPPPDEM